MLCERTNDRSKKRRARALHRDGRAAARIAAGPLRAGERRLHLDPVESAVPEKAAVLAYPHAAQEMFPGPGSRRATRSARRPCTRRPDALPAQRTSMSEVTGGRIAFTQPTSTTGRSRRNATQDGQRPADDAGPARAHRLGCRPRARLRLGSRSFRHESQTMDDTVGNAKSPNSPTFGR